MESKVNNTHEKQCRAEDSQMNVFKVLGAREVLTFWRRTNFFRRKLTVYNNEINVLWDLLLM